MLIHSPLHEAETEAGAVIAICAGRVCTIEPFEDVGDSVIRDADTVILYLERSVVGVL